MNPSADIRSWLEGIGLGELASLFEEHDISLDVLHTLDSDDLREMGISLGNRKRLLVAIAGLNEPTAPPAPPAREPQRAATPVRAPEPVQSAPKQMPVKAAAPVVRKVAAPEPAPAPGNPQPASDPQPVEHPPAAAGKKSKRKAFSASFLTVSISLHLILALGAGYWVVQRIEAKRKLQFAAGAPTANPNKRALEHKVSLQKKKNAGGSPAQAKRISVTGLAAKITLPEMPAVPTTSTQFVAGRMGGMGGAGFGSGLGFGNGNGMGVGGSGAGGLGLTMFGARGGSGLTGTFYDLKQTKSRKPSDMAGPPNEPFNAHSAENKLYAETVRKFVKDWNPSVLNKFYRAQTQLVTTQIFIPTSDAMQAPKAFGVEKECRPLRWLVHYKGDIIAPRTGQFRFLGDADDILVVRCNQQTVLDASFVVYPIAPEVNESNDAGPGGLGKIRAGKWIYMRAGQTLSLEVIIGECPGGGFANYLLIEEQGVPHPPGIYPAFQLRQMAIPGGPVIGHHGSIIFGSRSTGGTSPLNSIARP
jgi:hypothetical protein